MLTKPIASNWSSTKITASPSSHVGAREGPLSGIRLLRTLELTLFPNAQYPDTAAE